MHVFIHVCARVLTHRYMRVRMPVYVCAGGVHVCASVCTGTCNHRSTCACVRVLASTRQGCACVYPCVCQGCARAHRSARVCLRLYVHVRRSAQGACARVCADPTHVPLPCFSGSGHRVGTHHLPAMCDVSLGRCQAGMEHPPGTWLQGRGGRSRACPRRCGRTRDGESPPCQSLSPSVGWQCPGTSPFPAARAPTRVAIVM